MGYKTGNTYHIILSKTSLCYKLKYYQRELNQNISVQFLIKINIKTSTNVTFIAGQLIWAEL